MKNLKLIKIFTLLGPYPYNPYFIFLFFFAFYFSRYIPVVSEQPKGLARWEAGGLVMLISCLPSLIFAVAAYLVQRFRFWSSSNFIFYITEIALCQSSLLLINPLIQEIMKSRSRIQMRAPITLTLEIYSVSVFLVVIALALMHRAERIIASRLTDADDLVKRLESDREDLVNSGEELRRQTSQFLHDRVQSDLMVVGMKLRSLSGKSSAEVDDVINLAIERLEKTRNSDLRNLLQILAPNFEAESLSQALTNLTSNYQPSMIIYMNISNETESLDPKILLGIFRIVEQSILNSLVHGPAKRVDINIETNRQGFTRIKITDDGPGAALDRVATGVGTAVIESWVGILNGEKTIDTFPGDGYKLIVTFPTSL